MKELQLKIRSLFIQHQLSGDYGKQNKDLLPSEFKSKTNESEFTHARKPKDTQGEGESRRENNSRSQLSRFPLKYGFRILRL